MEVLAIGGTDKTQQDAIKYGWVTALNIVTQLLHRKLNYSLKMDYGLPLIAYECRTVLGFNNKQWIKITKSSLPQVWRMGRVSR